MFVDMLDNERINKICLIVSRQGIFNRTAGV